MAGGGPLSQTLNRFGQNPDQSTTPFSAPPQFAQPMTGSLYNQMLMQGQNNEQIRASQTGLFGSGPSDAQWNNIVTQAGMESGRPLPGSAQFYQPAYQPQYQNYAMTNPLGVSQYGQSFGGYGGGYYGGMGGYGMGMQTPFNPYTNSFQSPFAFSQQPQTNYGPPQQIVSRSSSMRGTPNVMMRRAEGGIASLVGDE